MSDERIPDDIMAEAHDVAWHWTPSITAEEFAVIIARAILAERNRVHKQLKGEGA